MGYSVYDCFLCENGHQVCVDVYQDTPPICPHCDAKFIWMESVNTTNGDNFHENKTPLTETGVDKVTCVCCKGKGHRKIETYEIPENGGKKINGISSSMLFQSIDHDLV